MSDKCPLPPKKDDPWNASEEEAQRRIAICRACADRYEDKMWKVERCRHCGCNILAFVRRKDGKCRNRATPLW